MTSVNPLFIDPENGDFRLHSTSSLIDAGMFLEGIDSDIVGNPKPIISTPAGLRGDGSGFDIGVYEFQGQADIRIGSQWALF